MLFTPVPSAAVAGHVGYLAGRYRDGAFSDHWTDARRCASGTFTAYAPACTCGWRGTSEPITDIAPLACGRRWSTDHLAHLSPASAGEYRNVTCASLMRFGRQAI
jgi:hypothetical protein